MTIKIQCIFIINTNKAIFAGSFLKLKIIRITLENTHDWKGLLFINSYLQDQLQ